MAKKASTGKAQAQASAAEPKAPKLTVAELAKQVDELRIMFLEYAQEQKAEDMRFGELVEKLLQAQEAQEAPAAKPAKKASAKKAPAKKAAAPKVKVERPTQEEWQSFRDAHKHEYEGLSKHDRNSILYKRLLAEKRAAAEKKA